MKQLLAALTLLVLASLPPTANGESGPFNVAVLTDLSGGMSIWGKQSVVGARMAQAALRKEGIEINLLIEDHQLSATKGVSALQKLTTSSNIDGAYIEFTAVIAAMIPMLNSHTIPFVYAAAATSPLSSSPWAAKTYVDYRETCRVAALTARDRGLAPLGLLKSVLEYGELCAEGIQRSGVPFVSEEYNPNDDVAPQLLRLKNKGVRALVHAAVQPDMLRMYQTLEKLRYNPTTLVNNDALPGAPLEFLRGKNLPILSFSTIQEDQKFLRTLKEFDPTNTSENSEGAFLASLHIKQIGRALASCRGKEKTEKDQRCVMEKILSAPADPDSGFQGFVERVAKFPVIIHEKPL